jgi:hypothetical protein
MVGPWSMRGRSSIRKMAENLGEANVEKKLTEESKIVLGKVFEQCPKERRRGINYIRKK